MRRGPPAKFGALVLFRKCPLCPLPSSSVRCSSCFHEMNAEDSLKDVDVKWPQMITQGTHSSHSGSGEAARWDSSTERCKLELS